MLNILDIVFLGLAVTAGGVGYVIKEYEKHVPAFIIKGYKYGSFAYQGSSASYLQIIEIPKALYRHFYAFSSIFSIITLVYAILVYCFEFSVNNIIFVALQYLLEQDKPSVSGGAALLSLTLIVIQCWRRCYETYYLQVFSKSGKMNLSHYMAGIIHYFGVIVAAIGEAPLFCGDQNREKMLWMDTRTVVLSLPCTLIFAWAWYEQFMSNIIFANLRKDKKSGEVVTEEHKIPHGRLFNYVSSPHRLCEMIIYVVLLVIVPTKTNFCILLWVLGNQTLGAFHVHTWYKTTFKDYPKNRWAVFPGVL